MSFPGFPDKPVTAIQNKREKNYTLKPFLSFKTNSIFVDLLLTVINTFNLFSNGENYKGYDVDINITDYIKH